MKGLFLANDTETPPPPLKRGHIDINDAQCASVFLGVGTSAGEGISDCLPIQRPLVIFTIISFLSSQTDYTVLRYIYIETFQCTSHDCDWKITDIKKKKRKNQKIICIS